MTIGERIKERRKELGMTVDELAEKLGKNRATIYRYESNEIEKLPTTVLEPLAKSLNVSPGYLMGWEGDDPAKIKGAIPYTPEKMIPIPVIGRVAAGYTCLAETDIECYELVNSEVLNSGYEYVYLKVVGDSMEPLILEGDLVLVRLQEIVESGDYAVVIVDEEDGVVKQIEFDNDCIKLISQNPYYPPRIFKGKSRERVRIYGKVVESKRKFN